MMRILYSSRASAIATDAGISEALESVSESFLRDVVNTLSFPRHFVAEPRNNRLAAEWITKQLQSYDYHPFYQGEYANVVAFLSPPPNLPHQGGGTYGQAHQGGRMFSSPPLVGGVRGGRILIGAHYDSVPGSPGADDNASAVAALLGCAKAVAEYAKSPPVCFVAFNREEDDLAGSKDFVDNYLLKNGIHLYQAHILEMVG